MIHLEYPGWDEGRSWQDKSRWCEEHFGRHYNDLDRHLPPELTEENPWYMYYLNGNTHWWFLDAAKAIMFRLRWG